MGDTPKVSLTDQIACVRRELAIRRNVYPSFVRRGKMTEEKRVLEMAHLGAVLETLEALRGQVCKHAHNDHKEEGSEIITFCLDCGEILDETRVLPL